MLYKLSHASNSEIEKIESQTGSYNDKPKHWRRVQVADLGDTRFLSYSPIFVEYRQIFRNDGPDKHLGGIYNATMFHYWDGTGVALVPSDNGDEMHYYAFGCSHEWNGVLTEKEKKSIVLIGHDKVWKCSKCGHIDVHDTSG